MKHKKLFIIIISFALVLIISSIILFFCSISPVDKNNDSIIEFTVLKGSSKNSIVYNLKKEKLIRNVFCTKVLVKLKNKELYAGVYKLSKDLSTSEILDKFSNQDNIENESIRITFVEGKKMSSYVKQISDNFPYSEEEINDVLSNKDYLNNLISKYWFIEENILDEGIYYPLEGYLYPDTYEFKKNSTIEEIIETFLNNMELKLNDYKAEIELSSYSIHQLLTLASIVELEGINSKDRGMVSGVLYNRLNIGMSLGSDVTTYYAVKKDFSKDLSKNDLDSCNGYNTRGSCVTGLPIGPICNAGLASISASIEPIENDYLYFVADNENNTYFSKSGDEHASTVSRLKSEGKWYTY